MRNPLWWVKPIAAGIVIGAGMVAIVDSVLVLPVCLHRAPYTAAAWIAPHDVPLPREAPPEIRPQPDVIFVVPHKPPVPLPPATIQEPDLHSAVPPAPVPAWRSWWLWLLWWPQIPPCEGEGCAK